MRKPSQWKHKENKSKVFIGQYKQYGRQRAFILKNVKNGKNRITFESHQAAVKLGWTKIA